MTTLLETGLSNVLVAFLLAVIAAVVGRWGRRPALAHGLWLLVLVKLVTPPLVAVPIPWLERPVQRAAAGHSGLLPVAAALQQPFAADEGKPAPEGEAEPIPNVEGEWTEGWPKPEVAGELAPELGGLDAGLDALEAALPAMADPAEAATGEPAFVWAWLLGGVWLVGSALWFALAGYRLQRFRRVLRHARPAPLELRQLAAAVSERLAVRCPSVWILPGVVSPMLWGLGQRVRLLLPEPLVARLSEEQRLTLLAHELAHLRRGDPWVRALELVALGLYWWCPLVWWARKELQEAEEECCDAWVVWALPGSVRAYALALVETVDFLSGAAPALPPVASGAGAVPLLRRRLTMIMRGNTPRALTAAGALALLGLAAVLLPLVPTWAQQPPRKDSERLTEQEEKELQELRRMILERRQAARAQGGQAEVQRMLAEIERTKAELRRAQHDIEVKTRALEEAVKRLQQTKEDPAPKQPGKGPGGFPGGFGPPMTSKPPGTGFAGGGGFSGGGAGIGAFPPGAGIGAPGMPGMMGGMTTGRADMDKRLEAMEKKLDAVLKELQTLRNALGKGPRASGAGGLFPAGPDAPGAGSGRRAPGEGGLQLPGAVPPPPPGTPATPRTRPPGGEGSAPRSPEGLGNPFVPTAPVAPKAPTPPEGR
jgi:beta-lactamase regulating signal transducer with metallopeptidase domain